jgi:anti-sigma B factor antagonist
MQQSTREITDGLFSVVSTRYGDEVEIVSWIGELDLAVITTAAAAVEDALAGGAGQLVLDLQKLEFLDSSGIALLSRLAARASDSATAVRVIPSDSIGVTRVLAVSGINPLLLFGAQPRAADPV